MILEDIAARLPRLLQMLAKHDKSIKFYALKKRLNAPTNEEFLELLVGLDPTGSLGKYLEWIAKQAVNGHIRLPEDGPRTLRALTIFNRVKNSSRFKGEKDINKYGFRELEQATAKHNGADNEDDPQSLREWTKWVESQGRTKFFGDQKFTVLKFENTGNKIVVGPSRIQDGIAQNWVPDWAVPDEFKSQAKAVDPTAVAVARLSTGTNWCTQNPFTAADYLKSGPMYAIFKDGQVYILTDAHWHQTMSTEDIPLSSASPALAYFFAKMLASTELPPATINVIGDYIRARIQRSEIEGKPIPEKAKQQMLQVVSSYA